MNLSVYNSENHSSAPYHAITHSTSLPCTSSSFSTLSELSNSSSYYRGSCDASLSLSSSLTSIEDLQAIPAYEDWNYLSLRLGATHDSILPFERMKRRRSLRERLGTVWNDVRRHLPGLTQGASLYNAIVGLVFCYYAWTLLLALSGFGRRQITAGDTADPTQCNALLLAQPFGDGSADSGNYSIPNPPVGL